MVVFMLCILVSSCFPVRAPRRRRPSRRPVLSPLRAAVRVVALHGPVGLPIKARPRANIPRAASVFSVVRYDIADGFRLRRGVRCCCVFVVHVVLVSAKRKQRNNFFRIASKSHEKIVVTSRFPFAAHQLTTGKIFSISHEKPPKTAPKTGRFSPRRRTDRNAWFYQPYEARRK